MTKPAGKGLFHTLVFFGHHSLIECVFVTFLISSPSYSSFIALKKIDKNLGAGGSMMMMRRRRRVNRKGGFDRRRLLGDY